MKTKYILSLLTLLLVMSSCDKKEWPLSDIKEVPIYYVSSITGTGTKPYALEVYREKKLLLEYKTAALLNAPLTTSNYVDASDDNNFNVKFRAEEKLKTALGVDTVLNRRYELSGVKATNVGQLIVVKYDLADSTVSTYSVKVVEDVRYN